MRWLLLIWTTLLSINIAFSQEKKPIIVGQKTLSTNQGQAITIELTDLHVEEQPTGHGNDGDDDSGNGGENDDDGDNENNGEGEDNEDNGEGEEDDDDDGDGKGKDQDKNKEKDKGKGKEKDKGKDKDGDRTASYPAGYTLEVFGGPHYSVSGTTVTPATDFTGVLTVDVRVRNDKHASAKYGLKITVNAVQEPPSQNIAPTITGQSVLTTTVNTPVTIRLSDLIVTDPDNAYPDGFTLGIVPGDHYLVQGHVVTPESDFTGDLAVRVWVNDGANDSPPFDLKIQVVAVENVRPVVIGQIPLSISQDQSVQIVLSHLLVRDADNAYPADFSLQVFAGENYSASENLITPAEGFTGDLFVRIAVNDGEASSEIFPLKITVVPAANDQPVITGQAGIRILEGQSLDIEFSHLVVHDNDDRYPQDFSLQVFEGDHYTLSGRTVTPDAGFLGTLSVKVAVHDGKTPSDPFPLKVQVVQGDQLAIVSQRSLEVPEDSSLFISLSDLVVNDPGKVYPQGFVLQMLAGENYDVRNDRIKPRRDFHGNLTVPVTVRGEGKTSAPFPLLVVVTPVNDAPELLRLPTEPIAAAEAGPWPVAEGIDVADVDDDHLLFAEIEFDPDVYQPGVDRFEYASSESIHTVFDADRGVLFLLGRASLPDYQSLIRSVSYHYIQSADSSQAGVKTIYIRLNDGKDTSPDYQRLLLFQTGPELEIPSAFTPNNDRANDTWRITLGDRVEKLNAFIRVYDRKGNMVFETTQLDTEWDGHYGGEPLPADVYFYTIEMDLAYKKVSYKGIVSILR